MKFTEVELVHRFNQQEPVAYWEVYAIYGAMLDFFVAEIVVHTEVAEDICEESLQEVFTHPQRYETLASIGDALFAAAERRCRALRTYEVKYGRNVFTARAEFIRSSIDFAQVRVRVQVLELLYQQLKRMPPGTTLDDIVQYPDAG